MLNRPDKEALRAMLESQVQEKLQHDPDAVTTYAAQPVTSVVENLRALNGVPTQAQWRPREKATYENHDRRMGRRRRHSNSR